MYKTKDVLTSIKNNKVDGYFMYMRNWSNQSKKELINKLTKSIEDKGESRRDFSSCFGTWIDDRTADEIIEDLYADRVNNSDIEEF